jgi:hypothetical protein
MKRIISISIFISFISITSFAQQASEKVFFVQGELHISDKPTMDSLQTLLRSKSIIKIARLDWFSKRIFILTQGIDSLSLNEFESWFGNFSSQLFCIQIGIYGVDTLNPYPFTNCN